MPKIYSKDLIETLEETPLKSDTIQQHLLNCASIQYYIELLASAIR